MIKNQPYHQLLRTLKVGLMATFVMSLLGISATAQSPLIEEIQALSEVKKGADFDAAEMPITANPFLSILPPGVKCDYKGWLNYSQRRQQFENMSRSLAVTSELTTIIERERPFGENDTQSTGLVVEGFGSGQGQINEVIITGISGRSDRTVVFNPAQGFEDDGSIPLANITGIRKIFTGETYPGLIGDGPVAGLSDFDFYQFDARAGQTLLVEVVTPEPFLDLDPFVSVFDAFGNLLAFNDDGDASSFDSFLRYDILADGPLYVCVGGFGAFIPLNPFDSQSGSIFGDLGSEGDYEMSLSLINVSTDIDYYLFDLEKGDVFAAGLTSKLPGSFLTVNNPAEELEVGASFNTGFYPAASPLTLAGTTTLYHVAEESGRYAIAVSGNFGEYQLQLLVTRPGLEITGGTQVIFLDYDGALFDVFEFFGIPGSDVRELSPLRDFMPNWGLPNDDRSVQKLTRRITRAVAENIRQDLRNSGINPNFNVLIVGNSGVSNPFALASSNDIFTDFGSLDDATQNLLWELEQQGPLFVSRVIVGGTIAESGIGTIGIAQSIDPGNFETEETALVLLDILSGPPLGDPLASFSFNDVQLAPGVAIEDLVAVGLGNIAAHEVGHYIGNWHTDGFDDIQTLMDEGPGGIFNLIGVGPSGVFGDEQTIDVDFITDNYSTLEVFFGSENTQNQSAYGFSSSPLYGADQLLAQTSEGVGAHLIQAYPNPALVNASIPIGFTVQEKVPVELSVLDFSGNTLAVLFQGVAEASKLHEIDFNPQTLQLRKGMYLYRLKTPDGAITNKILLK